MIPAEKIWWIKIVAALAVALLALAIQLSFDATGINSLILGIVIYMVMSDLLGSTLHIERSRGLRIGVGAYFLTWLTAWILLYTYFRPVA
jgi:hypothetical protein